MDFKYSIIDNIDYTLEEQGNQFTALRKVRWGDGEKDYLEIRRWRNTPLMLLMHSLTLVTVILKISLLIFRQE